MGALITYTNGFLYLESGSDNMTVWFQRCVAKRINKPLVLKHEVAAINLGIGGGERYWKWTVSNIYLTSYSDYETFITTLDDWQSAGTFTLGIKRNSGGDYIQYDGSNNTFTVMLKTDLGNQEKIAPGDQQIYVIDKLLFEQAG